MHDFIKIATEMSDRLAAILVPMGWEFTRRMQTHRGAFIEYEIVAHTRLYQGTIDALEFSKVISLSEATCYHRDAHWVKVMPVNWAKEMLCELVAILAKRAPPPFIAEYPARRRVENVTPSFEFPAAVAFPAGTAVGLNENGEVVPIGKMKYAAPPAPDVDQPHIVRS